MRPRRTLRVILHGKSRFAFYADTFYRLIIQVHMCYFNMIRFFHRIRVYTKAMVLRSDLTSAVTKFFTGWFNPLCP